MEGWMVGGGGGGGGGAQSCIVSAHLNTNTLTLIALSLVEGYRRGLTSSRGHVAPNLRFDGGLIDAASTGRSIVSKSAPTVFAGP